MKLRRRELLEVASLSAGGLFVFGCTSERAGTPDAGANNQDASANNRDAAANNDDAAADVDADADADAGQVTRCADPFANGQNLGNSVFSGETQPLDTKVGSGLGGRLFTDLTRVTADAPIVPNDRFYLRTFYPPTI